MTEDECDDRLEAIMKRFGFCGCGMPESAAEFIRGGLRLLADLQDKVWNESQTYAAWEERETAHFASIGGAYFFWYWLDKENLSEHGGSVPGWLDVTGRNLLAELDELLSTPPQEAE